jgi:hypothetical protein
MTDFAVFDISARLGDLKPPHVADGFLGTRQRIRYRVLKSVRRGANDLNLFVNMIRHALIISRRHDPIQQKPERQHAGEVLSAAGRWTSDLSANHQICFTNTL